MKNVRLGLLVISLIATVCMASFAAGSEESDSSSAGATAPNTGTLPLVPEVITLRYATHQGHNTAMAPPSNDLSLYQKLEELTNIHIEWETVPVDSYGEVMTTRIAAGGELPDILNLQDLGNYQKLFDDLLQDHIIFKQQYLHTNPLYKSMVYFIILFVYCSTQKVFAIIPLSQKSIIQYREVLNAES